MADIILEEQDGQDHVYNGVAVLSVRNASGSGRTNFLEQNGTVVTSVNGKYGDVELLKKDIPDNSVFTIEKIVSSLSEGSYSYNEEGYYEFTRSFNYTFEGSKDYFTMLLQMDATFVGEGEKWIKEAESNTTAPEGYVSLSDLSGSLTPQDIPILPARNAWIKNKNGDSWHVETQRPYFEYYTSNGGEEKDFVSHRCDIKSNVDFSLNQLRVVCPREQFTKCTITITIPAGAKLRIKSFSNKYEKNVPKEDSAFRYDSHFGKLFPSTHSKFQNTKKSYRFASDAGFSGCVCAPQITANGVIVCTHNESVPTSLTEESQITIGGKTYSISSYYINTEMTYNLPGEDSFPAYVTGTSYDPGDLVSYNNGKYVKIIESNQQAAPTDETQWTEIYTIRPLKTTESGPFYKGDCVLSNGKYSYCYQYSNNYQGLASVTVISDPENPPTFAVGDYIKIDDIVYEVESLPTTSWPGKLKAILRICNNTTVIPATDLLFWNFGEKTFEEFLQICASTGMSPVLSLHVNPKTDDGAKSVYRTIWKQDQGYSTEGGIDYAAKGLYWNPNQEGSGVDSSATRCYNSLSQKSWKKSNTEYYWYKKENLQKLKDLLDKYNLTSKVNIKSWGIDVVEFAYQIFGANIDGYTVEDWNSGAVCEPFRSISNLCNVVVESAAAWLYKARNVSSVADAFKNGCFKCACYTTENKLGSDAMLKEMGVFRILSDNNLNNGIE